MNAMVRRVLDAIHAAGLESAKRNYYWSDVLIEDGGAIARAAIMAMRDPTDDMVDEGLHDAEGFNLLGVNENSLAAAYERMINAALKETVQDGDNPRTELP